MLDSWVCESSLRRPFIYMRARLVRTRDMTWLIANVSMTSFLLNFLSLPKFDLVTCRGPYPPYGIPTGSLGQDESLWLACTSGSQNPSIVTL